VAHHCRASASVSAIHADIRHFVELSVKRTPYAISTACWELLRRNHVPLARSLNPMSADPRSKVGLIDAIGVAMEERCPGTTRWIASLRTEDAITSQPTELLDGYHEERSYADFMPPSDRAFHRSYKSSSLFTFVVREPADLAIVIVYRTPSGRSPVDVVEVSLNDRVVRPAPPSTRWRSERIDVAKETVCPGVNTMRVRWPLPAARWKERARRLCHQIDRLADEAATDVWPVCGEIASATVALRVGPCS